MTMMMMKMVETITISNNMHLNKNDKHNNRNNMNNNSNTNTAKTQSPFLSIGSQKQRSSMLSGVFVPRSRETRKQILWDETSLFCETYKLISYMKPGS